MTQAETLMALAEEPSPSAALQAVIDRTVASIRAVRRDGPKINASLRARASLQSKDHPQ